MILEPFYFGQNKSCFGHFTPASGLAQGKSVLIIPSIFGEAIRSHRVLREVARTLSSRGFDVLRFDFDGDGNSWSDTNDVSVQLWVNNIKDAYAELVKRSPDSSISVLATRFGAGLSLLTINELAVESMLFWDPILSKNEMYNIFVGPEPVIIESTGNGSNNPFTSTPDLRGFLEVGLGKDFADGFLKLDEITLSNNDLQIIETTDTDSGVQKLGFSSNVIKVEHHCDWQIKDLPVIFAPKLISTICGCL